MIFSNVAVGVNKEKGVVVVTGFSGVMVAGKMMSIFGLASTK